MGEMRSLRTSSSLSVSDNLRKPSSLRSSEGGPVTTDGNSNDHHERVSLVGGRGVEEVHGPCVRYCTTSGPRGREVGSPQTRPDRGQGRSHTRRNDRDLDPDWTKLTYTGF